MAKVLRHFSLLTMNLSGISPATPQSGLTGRCQPLCGLDETAESFALILEIGKKKNSRVNLIKSVHFSYAIRHMLVCTVKAGNKSLVRPYVVLVETLL